MKEKRITHQGTYLLLRCIAHRSVSHFSYVHVTQYFHNKSIIISTKQNKIKTGSSALSLVTTTAFLAVMNIHTVALSTAAAAAVEPQPIPRIGTFYSF